MGQANDIAEFIVKATEATMKDIEKDLVQELLACGEEGVIAARNDHPNNWQDQTGKLRSSIGYSLVKDGVVIVDGKFEQIDGPNGSGAAGVSAGQQALNEIVSAHKDGISLVMVAGADYAQYVEDIHHKDVLTGAQRKVFSEAEQSVKMVLKKHSK